MLFAGGRWKGYLSIHSKLHAQAVRRGPVIRYDGGSQQLSSVRCCRVTSRGAFATPAGHGTRLPGNASQKHQAPRAESRNILTWLGTGLPLSGRHHGHGAVDVAMATSGLLQKMACPQVCRVCQNSAGGRSRLAIHPPGLSGAWPYCIPIGDRRSFATDIRLCHHMFWSWS
jgi:hypothetical protein